MKKIKYFNHSKPNLLKNSVLFILAIGLLTLFFASCKHDDLSVSPPNENIRPAGDFVKNNYELSLFYAALKKVGYIDQLNTTGPFTVLAPTDAAFNELGIYNATDFDKMNVDSLKKVIGYHILPRQLRVSDVPSNGIDVRYATLEGSELYASLVSETSNGGSPSKELYFCGAEATRKDVVLANGTLHVLDKVMKPNFNNTVQQWLAQHADYSVFVKGLKKFNLWDQLATTGPFTIFAPDNKALENIGITEASLAAMDTNRYLGDFLFGVYIMYDKHFFISDSQVFTVINSDGKYEYFLKNDPHYMRFESVKYYPDFKLSYMLTLRTGNTGIDFVVKSVVSNLKAKNDNLCSNGVIHHLVDGLVTPGLAIKK